MFETPRYRLVDHHELQIAECGFVLFMSLELGLKILADGLFFTPKALFKDAAGILDIFTFSVSAPSVFYFLKDFSLISSELITGEFSHALLDAQAGSSKFGCPAASVVALLATNANFHSGAAHAQSSL